MKRTIITVLSLAVALSLILTGCFAIPVLSTASISPSVAPSTPTPTPSPSPSPSPTPTPSPTPFKPVMTTEPSGRTVLETETTRLSVMTPEGWIAIQSSRTQATMGIATLKRDIFMIITVYPLPKGTVTANTDNEEFWKGFITEDVLKIAFGSFLKSTKIQKKGWTDVNGKLAYYRIMSGKSYDTEYDIFNGKTVKKVFYLFPNKDSMAAIYFEALPDAYKKYENKEIKQILDTLTVEVK